jgi:long-chain acyl-CoA synthetase
VNAASEAPTSLADVALRRAVRDPSSPFILTVDDGAPDNISTLTYGEAVGRAAALARVLAVHGVGRGDRVGCYLPNTPAWVVASLAVWFLDAAVAAVGTMLPGAEAERLLMIAEAKVVIAGATAPPIGDRFQLVRVSDAGTVDGLPSHPLDEALAELEPPTPGALAVAIFTSGTTGQPKGITHTHNDLIAAVNRVAAGYARTSSYRPAPAPAHLPPGLSFSPFGHMAAFTRLSLRMWTGRPLLIVPKFSVAAAQAVLSRFPFDTLQLTPTMIHMLATTDEHLDMRKVKYVTSGTAPLPLATRELFERRYGVPVMQAYGMSEVGAVAQERYDDVIAGRRGPGSVGRLAEGVEVRIRPLDDDRPAGEGEILVRTDEATQEFLGGAPVPIDADGWFPTGDVGRVDDGILYITGRVQEKMIVGGFNVYPAEVEDVARRSPLVADVVVVGVPDDRLGERPVAGVVWAGTPDESALLADLRDALAHYKVPRALFTLEAVPLTPRDKVDRKRAAELACAALGIRAG